MKRKQIGGRSLMDEVNHVNGCLVFGYPDIVLCLVYAQCLTMFNVGCMGYELSFGKYAISNVCKFL